MGEECIELNRLKHQSPLVGGHYLRVMVSCLVLSISVLLSFHRGEGITSVLLASFFSTYFIINAVRASGRSINLLDPLHLLSSMYMLVFWVPLIVFSDLIYEERVEEVILVALLGLVTFSLGYLFPVQAKRLEATLRTFVSPIWSLLRLKLMVLGLYLLSLVTRWFLMIRYGVFYNDILGGYAEATPFMGVYTTLAGTYLFSYALLSIMVFGNASNERVGRAWKILWFSILIFEIVLSLVRGVKGGVIVMILITFIAWYGLRRELGSWRFLLGGVGCALVISFVFAILPGYRQVAQVLGSSSAVHLSPMEALGVLTDIAIESVQEFSHLRYRHLETIVARLSHVEVLASIVRNLGTTMDYEYGRSYLFILTAFVPRFLWPDKPKALMDAEYAIQLGLQSPEHLTVTDFGTVEELYVNFGFIGVALGMGVFGFMVRFIYDTLHGTRQVAHAAVFLYIFLLRAILDSLEHPSSQVIFGVIRDIPVLVATHLWLSRAGSSTSLRSRLRFSVGPS